MTDRIGVAAICLHITSAIYLIAGLAFLGYSLAPAQPTRSPSGLGLAGCVLLLAFAAGIEMVARGLRRRMYWGWVAGVCILTLYIPTVFLPFGAVGLWALLTPATRALFGVGPLTSVSRRPGSSSMASVTFRLLLLTIALIAAAFAYVRISGAGMPPYHPVPEPSELERVHRLVGLALFAVAALSTASLASAFVALILVRYRRRAS
jgi:chromate transport protein ChrA